MKLVCKDIEEYINEQYSTLIIQSMDIRNIIDVYFKNHYKFGTKQVSCGWCENNKCMAYDDCTRGYWAINCPTICTNWKMDYI